MPPTSTETPGLDLSLKLAALASFVTVGLPILGLVLVTSGASKDGGRLVETMLLPLQALMATAPYGLVVPLAALAWLNVAGVQKARTKARTVPGGRPGV